ncbi:hypothetical protein [Micromonospora sp. NPDC049301]|uniref:hypothetical protein n=1 Tax=Micromonospora sp. NPDC049301 TaxID=3155723 RepID=UPI003413DD24
MAKAALDTELAVRDYLNEAETSFGSADLGGWTVVGPPAVRDTLVARSLTHLTGRPRHDCGEVRRRSPDRTRTFGVRRAQPPPMW